MAMLLDKFRLMRSLRDHPTLKQHLRVSGPPSKSAVRLVERVFDLTAIPETSSSGAIRVVSSFHKMDSSSFHA